MTHSGADPFADDLADEIRAYYEAARFVPCTCEADEEAECKGCRAWESAVRVSERRIREAVEYGA